MRNRLDSKNSPNWAIFIVFLPSVVFLRLQGMFVIIKISLKRPIFTKKSPFYYFNLFRQNLGGVSVNFGGTDEDRTRYLIVANDALSQMSYSPTLSKVYQNCEDLQELYVILHQNCCRQQCGQIGLRVY